MPGTPEVISDDLELFHISGMLDLAMSLPMTSENGPVSNFIQAASTGTWRIETNLYMLNAESMSQNNAPRCDGLQVLYSQVGHENWHAQAGPRSQGLSGLMKAVVVSSEDINE